MLQFKFNFLNANIIIELAIWRINVLMSIIVRIMEIIIILKIDDSYWRILQEWIFTISGLLLGSGLQQPRRYISHSKEFSLK